MSEEIRFFIGLGVTALFNAALIGGAWGGLSSSHKLLREDVSSIKRTLGMENGTEGTFVRRSEYETREHGIDNRLAEIREDLAALRERADRG